MALANRLFLRPVEMLAVLCSLMALQVSGRPFTNENNTPEQSEINILLRPLEVHLRPSWDSEENVLQEDGYYVFGDIKVNTRRQAVMNKTRLWPGGLVPYVLDKSYTQEIRDTIERSMREIEESVGNSSFPCVRFLPRTTEVNYVDVRNGDSCSSVIGLDYTGPQVSTFSSACAARKSTIVHELLHTLGLYHEQDRYDRDNYVTVNTTNLREDAFRDYVKRNRSDIDTLDTPYDLTSIMHYGPYSFPKDPRWPVMTPKQEYARGHRMGQRDGLSHLDVLRVQRLYHCPEDTTHIVSDVSENNILAWCDFENENCNFSTSLNVTKNEDNEDIQNDVTNSKVYWIITSNPTPDGPKAGFTNGLDPFFYASKEYCEEILLGTSKKQPNLNLNHSVEPVIDSTTSLNSRDTSDNTTQVVPQQSGTQTTDSIVTVSLKTPTMTSNVSDVCLDFRICQPGPTSYLEIYIMGPLFSRLRYLSIQDRSGYWKTVRYTMTLAAGIEFQLEFVAVLSNGSVALDDIHILNGSCQ